MIKNNLHSELVVKVRSLYLQSQPDCGKKMLPPMKLDPIGATQTNRHPTKQFKGSAVSLNIHILGWTELAGENRYYVQVSMYDNRLETI